MLGDTEADSTPLGLGEIEGLTDGLSLADRLTEAEALIVNALYTTNEAVNGLLGDVQLP